MPGPELVEASEEGRIALGGCVLDDEMSNWECTRPDRHQ
jgi:hypothetical protein